MSFAAISTNLNGRDERLDEGLVAFSIPPFGSMVEVLLSSSQNRGEGSGSSFLQFDYPLMVRNLILTGFQQVLSLVVRLLNRV
jgi:hypothetical protein